MTWTYNAAALSTSDRAKVRLMIGDTDSSRQQLQDEEIDYVLTQETSPTLAAAACCDLLAAKYAYLVNTENSELRVSAAARFKHYQDLADRLREGGAGTIPLDGSLTLADMYVGGASRSDKQALAENSDIVQPSFSIGQDDFPTNPQSDALTGTDDFDI